jgi:hypothetical protein
MKKILLSTVIVFGSFIIVSAQTGKNIYGSKAQNNVNATSQAPAKPAVSNKQNKTELEQKVAIKKEQSLKSSASKSKPKAAMSLVEAQQ